MASQKHWLEATEESNSIDVDHEEDDLFTQEEAEAIFKFECKQWIINNQEKLLNSPFAQAYKKPWTKKTSSLLETGGKKKLEK